MVAKRAQRTGGGGTATHGDVSDRLDRLPAKGEGPEQQGRVDVNGRIVAAWGR